MLFLKRGNPLSPLVLYDTLLQASNCSLKARESVSTGAFPLLGLYDPATGGGLLADFPSVACFRIKCEDISGGSG